MESELCCGADVVVVGGGNSAGQGAVYLSKHARNVHILVRRDGLAETMSRYLIRRIEETSNIQLHARSEITRLICDARLHSIEYEDGSEQDGPPGRRLGLSLPRVRPCTGWLEGTVALDEKGFIKTGAEIRPQDLKKLGRAADPNRRPSMFETSMPRVYAMGDVRSGSVKDRSWSSSSIET